MKTAKITDNSIALILGMMGKENALAMKICLTTGMRISDTLALTREQVEKGRFTVKEEKTGKSRRVRLPVDLQREALHIAGRKFIFEGRDSWEQHRTRQAVSRDIHNVLERLELAGYMPRVTTRHGDPTKITIGTHSMRKTYVRKLEEQGADIETIRSLLNHDSDLTTLIYVMAAEVDFRKSFRRKKGPAFSAGPFGCGNIGRNIIEAAPDDVLQILQPD